MVWGSVVKSAAGGVKKMAANRAQKIGKSKAGKLLAREGRVMMGKPQPKGQHGGAAPTVQPQVSLAPTAPDTGGGSKSFKSEKEAALQIKTTTIEVATLLKGSYVLQKERLKNQRTSAEQEKRGKAEGKLEKDTPKVKGFKMPKMPGGGLVDKVFGFVGSMIFGVVMIKLVDFLPTLTWILPILGRVADWFISAGLFAVNVLGTFINWGYKLVDGMENMVKGIFGEEGAETFKTFMTNIKDLIAAFLVWKWVGKKIVTALVKNIKLAWTIAKGIVANAFKVVNFLTGGAAQKGLTAVTKGLTKIGTSIAKRTGLTAAKKMGGSLFKHGAKRAGKRVLLKMLGKTFVKNASKIFGRVPIVGPLIVGLVSLVSGEPIGQALFKTFGAGLGGFLGGIAGAAITAAIGTVTAGIGLILVPIITPASMMIGEILGTFVGDMLYGLIFGGGLSGVGTALKDAFAGIFQKIAEGLQWISELPIISQLIQIVQNPGDMLMNFGRWIFFDAIPWVTEKLGGAAKLLKEWFDKGMERFVDNFPVFNLPLMKGKILYTIPYNINFILGQMFGGIEWFQQWINGEGELMHFPDFSMFIPLVGLPFLMGHVGKSLFPGSFFDAWPSGLSAFTNPIGASIHEKLQGNSLNPGAALSGDGDSSDKMEQAKAALEEMKNKVGDAVNSVTGAVGDAWNWLTGGGDDETVKNALKSKNEGDKSETTEVSIGSDALDSKNKVLEGEGGPDGSIGNTSSAVENKLKTANQQGGAKAVIESISTTASYEEGTPEVITLPAPTSTPSDAITTTSKAGAPLVLSGGGNNDPYEALYKGG